MSEIYRDRSEGAAARRQELLRRRRDELVTMPHAVRRVVVARSARIAAGMFATLAGAALIAAAWSPELAARLQGMMPGLQPAPLSTLLFGGWILCLVAWSISRARFEHRFAVAMSRYVLPTSDVDRDVERLDHEHPDDIARAMGHALEVRSAAWPILAIAALLPATALWVGWVARSGGDWPVSELEDSLALHAQALALIAAAGAIGAVAMTRKAMRQPAVAMIALPFALITLGLGVAGFVDHPALAWTLAGVSVVGLAIGVMARKLRRERALLEIDDPAAGSELFTIRGALREVRAGLATARTALVAVRRRYWVMLMTAGLISTAIGLVLRPGPPAPLTPASPTPALAVASAPVVAVDGDRPSPNAVPGQLQPYTLTRSGTSFRIDVTLDDQGDATVPVTSFAVLPDHWLAALQIDLPRSAAGPLAFGAGRPIIRVAPGARTVIDLDACAGPRPLILHLAAPAQAGRRVTFHVTPHLTIADCT